MTQIGRPPEAAPSDFYEDPNTGDIYINDVLFTPGGGSSGGSGSHEGVFLATITALPAYTYSNGTSGVGATLTGNANGLLAIDGVDVEVGQRVLIKSESTLENNGIYSVTVTGSGGAAFVLTRAMDFDEASDIKPGAVIVCLDGFTQVGKIFYVEVNSNPTIGTDSISFAETSGGGQVNSVVAGSGIAVDNTDPANPEIAVDTGVAENTLLKSGAAGEPVASSIIDDGAQVNVNTTRCLIGTGAPFLDVGVNDANQMRAGSSSAYIQSDEMTSFLSLVSAGGKLLISNLPTSDPVNAGQLYTVDATAVLGVGAILIAISDG